MQAPTLLIVEDEDRMRRLFELVLKPAGYQLLLARSGDEALRLIQDHDALDMIITDLQLGAISGMQVLEAARQQVPDVPVLIVTTYFFDLMIWMRLGRHRAAKCGRLSWR
jgi:CheY-like chemotaxis protein